MIKALEEFRNIMDCIMNQCINKRIILYGYGRTGEFIQWYANYYHSIKIDYIINLDWSPGVPRALEYYSETLFQYNYKDVKDAIVWLAIPENKECIDIIENGGYIKNKTWFSFYEAIYGNEYVIQHDQEQDPFNKKKSGIRDIQFMDWLEYKYNCNLLEDISSTYFENLQDGMRDYVVTTHREIFHILDKCHCKPQEKDGIFDFGCGKGGAMLSFLDYGFKNIGGVEYQQKIHKILKDNFEKVEGSIEKTNIKCIHGDAVQIKEELDGYNWFYYFEPFGRDTFRKTIENIVESKQRRPRKITIININPLYYDEVLNTGEFILTNQFWICTRKKVVDIFVSK